MHTPNTMLCEPIKSKQKPTTAIDAKFSIPFCVALALAHKKITLKHFAPSALVDSDVLQLAKKITYEIAAAPDQKYAAPKGLVRVKTKHQEIISEGIEFVYGHPRNPMTQEALIDKFMDCAAYSARKIPKKNLNKMVQLILHLEDVKNMSEIVDYL